MLFNRKIKLSELIVTLYVLLAVVFTSMYSVITYLQFKNFTLDNFENYGSLLCRNIAFASSDYMFTGAYPSLNFVVEEFFDSDDLDGLSIVNNEGVIVADSDPQRLGNVCEYFKDCGAEVEICINNRASDGIVFQKNIKIDELLLGNAVVMLSLDRINQKLNRILYQTIITSSIFLILILVTGVYLGRGIAFQIVRLSSAIKNFAADKSGELEGPQRILELQELQSSYSRMRKELLFREDELKTAKQESEKANRAKSAFLANISHELRTPLNGILGFSSLLKNTGLSESQQILVEQIDSSGAGLAALIRNLLDLVELESGECELYVRSFSLKTLIDKIVLNIEAVIRNKDIKIETAINENCDYIYGDQERIEQALMLLLSNAVKFTNNGRIAIKVYRDEDDYLVIEIHDSGVGIREDKIHDVFELLSQGEEPLTKTHRGAGIGLPMVKLLAGLMGGDVKLKSDLGVGTSVLLRLRAENAESITVTADKDCENFRYNKRLLLVEDEAVNRMYLKMVLERAGYSVEEAVDGYRAIDYFQKREYCAVLMDIGLPGINGIETFKQISRSTRYKKKPVPVIAVTASTENDTRESCYKSGMVDFITKPVNEQELINTIRKAVIYMTA